MQLARTLVSFCALTALAACGGGGGGGAPAPAPAPGFNAGVSLNGPWKLTYTVTGVTGDTAAVDSDNDPVCDPVGDVDVDSVTLTQTGNSLKIVQAGQPDITLTINGRSVTLESTEDDAGIRGAFRGTLNFAADGNSATGTYTETNTRISDGSVVCTVTGTLTAARDTSGGGGGGTPVNVVGNFTGTVEVTASSGPPCLPVGPSTSDTWTIAQTGTAVTWDAGDTQNELSGTLTGLNFTGSRTDTATGTTVVRTRNVTFSADGSSFNGTDVYQTTGASTCTYTETISGTRGSGGGGGGTSGSLIVKLSWAGPNQADLDLGVQEPGGAVANLNMPSTIGGVFSGDILCGASPEETWTYASAPAGSWNALVRWSDYCVPQTMPFAFTVSVQKPSETSPTLTMGTFATGTPSPDQQMFPFSF